MSNTGTADRTAEAPKLAWKRERDEFGDIEYTATGNSGYEFTIRKDTYHSNCYPWVTGRVCMGYATLREAKAAVERGDAERVATGNVVGR